MYNNPEKVKEGLPNLKIHIENMLKFNSNLVVAINKYDTDTDEEIEVVTKFLGENNIHYAITTSYKDGGEGAISLANEVLELLKNSNDFKPIYSLEDDISL